MHRVIDCRFWLLLLTLSAMACGGMTPGELPDSGSGGGGNRPDASLGLGGGLGTTGGGGETGGSGGAVGGGSTGGGVERTDAGIDGGVTTPSLCERSSAMICEGFESGNIDAGVWDFKHEAATGVIETSRVARGKYALHINMANQNSHPWNFGWLVSKRTFNTATTRYYVRAFVYLEPQLPTRHFSLMYMLGTTKSPAGSEWGYILNVVPNPSSSSAVFRQIWNYPAGYGTSLFAKEGPRAGGWECWEWMLGGPKHELAFSVDGKPISSMSVGQDAGLLPPPEAHLKVGLATSHVDSYGDAGYDAWIDEIAVSTSPIGCKN